MASLMKLLQKGDGPTTIAFFKGMGLFRDKSGIEIEGNWANLSNDELRDIEQQILDRVAVRTGATGEAEEDQEVSGDQ